MCVFGSKQTDLVIFLVALRRARSYSSSMRVKVKLHISTGEAILYEGAIEKCPAIPTDGMCIPHADSCAAVEAVTLSFDPTTGELLVELLG